MRLTLLILLLALLPVFGQENNTRPRTAPGRAARDKQIAARFAPIIHQGLGEQPRSDYLTSFDFDGDWKGDNNWRNTDNRSFALRAYVYYSVSETTTHYFVHYAVFHPRDYKGGLKTTTLVDTLLSEGLRRIGKDPTGYADDVALSHENDLEGCLVVAEKQSQDTGAVQYVETLAHNRYYKYRAAEIKSDPGETIELSDGHPILFAEPKGHGLARYTGFREQLRKSTGGALIYSYKGQADDPERMRDKNIGYDLIPIYDTLWQQAQQGENETYGEAAEYQKFTVTKYQMNASGPNDSASGQSVEHQPGTLGSAFRGTVGFKNKARPPWGWFDQMEKERPAGEWFFDPAGVIARHFSLGESFSRSYTYHQYFKIGVQ
jgi:hypothetical protein